MWHTQPAAGAQTTDSYASYVVKSIGRIMELTSYPRSRDHSRDQRTENDNRHTVIREPRPGPACPAARYT